MSKPRKKIPQNLRRTAQHATRIAGHRIPACAYYLADELNRVRSKTESDPTAVQPCPMRTTEQHHIPASDRNLRNRRKRAQNLRRQILHIVSAFLFILLAVTLIIGTIAAILSAIL